MGEVSGVARGCKSPSGRGRLSQGLAVGLAAAIAWLAPMAAVVAVRFADRAIAAAGENPPPAVSIRLGRLVDAQEVSRAALSIGLIGLTLGVATYLAPSLADRRRSFAVSGLLMAATIGLGSGAAVGAAGGVAFALRQVGSQDLTLASVLQGLVWAGVGSAAGASSSVRLADRSSGLRAIGRGFLAGLLWGLAYPALVALFSTWTHAERMIPEGPAASIAWASLGTAVVGLAVVVDPRGRPAARESGSAGTPLLDDGDPAFCRARG